MAKLAVRVRDAHKGDFGHVLIAGGDRGMAGAAHLAALGALRVGAGLVSLATREGALRTLEVMSHAVPRPGHVKPLLDKATIVVLGPGLGQSAWSHCLFGQVLKSDLPLIVDADALKLLAEQPMPRHNWILTPHPGEAATLLGVDVHAIQADRPEAAREIQKQYGGMCVLKGAGTVVAGGGEAVWTCAFGNPGMASGGMGDLLAGIIAGLVAQKMTLLDAAVTGVEWHAKAGDEVRRVSGERGMIATDLLPFVRQFANE